MNIKKVTHRLIRPTLVLSSLALWLTLPLAALDSKVGVLRGKVEFVRGARDQNAIVYLKGIEGQFPPPQEAALLDQKGKVFVPHLLPVQKGQKVIFENGDPFSHNTHLYWGRRSLFNKVQGIGGSSEWVPKRTGEYLILCDIHREMSASVLVFDHPFFAIVDPQGSGEFKIENVPEGTYTLVVVRDVRGKLKRQEHQVTVTAEAAEPVSVTVE